MAAAVVKSGLNDVIENEYNCNREARALIGRGLHHILLYSPRARTNFQSCRRAIF